jgi:hypothetical protein
MGTLRVALVTGAVAVAMTASGPAGAAPGQVAFNGTWTSIDTDGSHQVMRISGGGQRRAIMLYDDSATSACQGQPALVSGAGVVDGPFLFSVVSVVCLPGGNPLRGRVEFALMQSGDTLVDASGVVWTRA